MGKSHKEGVYIVLLVLVVAIVFSYVGNDYSKEITGEKILRIGKPIVLTNLEEYNIESYDTKNGVGYAHDDVDTTVYDVGKFPPGSSSSVLDSTCKYPVDIVSVYTYDGQGPGDKERLEQQAVENGERIKQFYLDSIQSYIHYQFD